MIASKQDVDGAKIEVLVNEAPTAVSDATHGALGNNSTTDSEIPVKVAEP